MSDRAPKARWGMGLRREDGAEYVGMSPSQFDAAVKAGAIPPSFTTYGTVKVWHRRDLDAFLEDRRAAAGLDANEWDDP